MTDPSFACGDRQKKSRRRSRSTSVNSCPLDDCRKWGIIVEERCIAMLSRGNTTPIRDRIHGERVIAERVRKCVLRYHQCLYVLGYEQTRIALCISQIVIYEIKFHGLWYTGCTWFVKSCRCIVLSSHSYHSYGLIGFACRSVIVDHIADQMSTWRQFCFPTALLYVLPNRIFYFILFFY